MQRRNVSMRLLIAVVVLLLPLGAVAQEEDELLEEPIEEYGGGELFDEVREPDWIPTLKVGVGVDTQFTEGTVMADQIQTLGPFDVSFQGTDDNPVDGPAATGAIEIMGPEIFDGVRPFFTAGLRDQLEGGTVVSRAQAMGDLQNTRVRLTLEVLQDQWWFAGLGAAFQLPFEGYNVKFKPSINYVGLKSEVAGVIIQPILLTSSTTNDDFRQESRSAITNHGISPRVELDAEVYRQGPISVGLYAELESMILLSGPLQHDFSTNSCRSFGTSTPPCAGADGSTGRAVFSLERSKVIIYGGVGLRVSWMGY